MPAGPNAETLKNILGCDQILSHMQDGFFVVHDGRLVFASRKLAELIGYSSDELLDLPVEQLIAPEHRKQVLDAYFRRIEGEPIPAECECRLLHRNGTSRRTVRANIGTTVGRDGERYTIGTVKDITSTQRLLDDLRASEEDLLRIIDHLPDVFYQTNADGILTMVSPACKRILGFEPEEMLDRPLADFYLDPGERDEVVRRIREAAGSPVAVEAAMRRKDGSAAWVAAHAYLRLDSAGRPLGVEGLARDLSGRKAAEDRLVAANRELDTFAAAASHDLRAPLRHINGLVAAALEDAGECLPEGAAERLSRVFGITGRMQHLVEGLLELSRISRSEQVERRPVDLSAMARAIIADLQRDEPDRLVEVSIEPGLTAEGDPSLIHVALANLLGNAWKFTAEQRQGRIEVGREALDGETLFVIRDNGIGFDPRDAKALFLPFHRLESDSRFPGFGLGLSNVRKVIEKHGGRIWLDSEPQRGTTCRFTLEPPPEH